ncbi:Cocaine esterase [Planctomycetaceae bacterium]|nr:Cocaine esterase [Planctomycetaceae bacterium]
MAMRTTLALALTLLALTCIDAQEVPTPDEPKWVSELRDVAIPMRDGKSLAANVLLPKKAGKYPCVLVQTPYNKNNMGREYGDAERAGEAARGSAKAWARFDRENYAYCFVDWRGFYGSKAALQGVNKRTWKRGQDGFDCVEWCASQEWCNGKIGTWGGSALGKQQFDTAAEQPPHLVCAAPLIAYQGQRYEAYYEGGVKLEAHVNALDRLGFGVGEMVGRASSPDAPVWSLAKRMSYTPEKIAVPCLLVSGWWDNYPRDVIENFTDIVAKGGEQARKHSRLIMGPWAHTAIDMPKQGDLEFKAAEDYSTKITVQFFDHFLRDQKDNGYDKLPRVHFFQCGEDKWLTAESISAFKRESRELYLQSSGAINAEKPAARTDEAKLERGFKYDPKKPSPTIGGANLPPLTYGPEDCAAILKREDVLVYSTGKLTEPLALFGSAEIEFTFTVNRADCDFHVRLLDDNGKTACLVAEGIQRAKWRSGKQELLTPGQAARVKVKLSPSCYTFLKDHELKLVLTCGNSPRYERNTHTGEDGWDDSKALALEVVVHHDAPRPAMLRLPTK